MPVSRDVVLSVEGLNAHYLSDGKISRAVNDVTFEVQRGESVGLFGESGAGKSTVGYSIIGLFETIAKGMSSSSGNKESKELWALREDANRRGLTSKEIGKELPGIEGRILFEGRDLLSLDDEELQKIVGKTLTHIPQGTGTSLNPALSLKELTRESAERSTKHEEIEKRILEKLDLIDFGDAKLRKDTSPAHLSIGEVQRILTALALIPHPSLVVADEPTTAVDTMIRNWILDAIALARSEMGLSLLVISNNRTVIAETVERVAVMSAGYIMEFGDVKTVLNNPGHPFSRDFLMSSPTMEMMRKIREKGLRLRGIPGSPPSSVNLPTGCAYHPRCEDCKDICKKELPEYREVESGHWIRCHRYEELKD